MFVGFRRLGFAAVAAAVLSAGCGSMALYRTPAVPGDSILAAPMQVDSLAAAVKGTTRAMEGAVPRFEIIGGISLLGLGDKSAGLEAPSPAPLVAWSQMYDRGTGFDVQIVLRRPPRAAASLTMGDTLMVVRGTIETYGGKTYPFGTADGLTIFGVWLEGRTLLNPLDAGGNLRPYLQYGGGVMFYSETTVSGLAHWDPTTTLGWRMALGIEFRKGRLGFYAESGVQTVGAPDVAQYYLDIGSQPDIDLRIAQNLVTFPIRLGLILSF